MNKIDRIENFYRKLYSDDFILTHGFERFRFEEQKMYACASTLKSRSGREITISFNIHDEEPDEAELVIQFLNKSSVTQLRKVGEELAERFHKDINIYEEPECISMVSYFDIEDAEGIILMFKAVLEEVDRSVLFTVNN